MPGQHMLDFTFATCGSLNMSISKTNHVENIIKANQHNNTRSETSYRITDVECIARAQTIP